MADLVNLQQTEYESILFDLFTLHETEAEQVRSIIKDIRNLSEIDGGFYVEKISDKIKDLLNALDQSAQAALEDNFDLTIVNMKSFMESIVSIDAGCM